MVGWDRNTLWLGLRWQGLQQVQLLRPRRKQVSPLLNKKQAGSFIHRASQKNWKEMQKVNRAKAYLGHWTVLISTVVTYRVHSDIFASPCCARGTDHSVTEVTKANTATWNAVHAVSNMPTANRTGALVSTSQNLEGQLFLLLAKSCFNSMRREWICVQIHVYYIYDYICITYI